MDDIESMDILDNNLTNPQISEESNPHSQKTVETCTIKIPSEQLSSMNANVIDVPSSDHLSTDIRQPDAGDFENFDDLISEVSELCQGDEKSDSVATVKSLKEEPNVIEELNTEQPSKCIDSDLNFDVQPSPTLSNEDGPSHLDKSVNLSPTPQLHSKIHHEVIRDVLTNENVSENSNFYSVESTELTVGISEETSVDAHLSSHNPADSFNQLKDAIPPNTIETTNEDLTYVDTTSTIEKEEEADVKNDAEKSQKDLGCLEFHKLMFEEISNTTEDVVISRESEFCSVSKKETLSVDDCFNESMPKKPEAADVTPNFVTEMECDPVFDENKTSSAPKQDDITSSDLVEETPILDQVCIPQLDDGEALEKEEAPIMEEVIHSDLATTKPNETTVELVVNEIIHEEKVEVPKEYQKACITSEDAVIFHFNPPAGEQDLDTIVIPPSTHTDMDEGEIHETAESSSEPNRLESDNEVILNEVPIIGLDATEVIAQNDEKNEDIADKSSLVVAEKEIEDARRMLEQPEVPQVEDARRMLEQLEAPQVEDACRMPEQPEVPQVEDARRMLQQLEVPQVEDARRMLQQLEVPQVEDARRMLQQLEVPQVEDARRMLEQPHDVPLSEDISAKITEMMDKEVTPMETDVLNAEESHFSPKKFDPPVEKQNLDISELVLNEIIQMDVDVMKDEDTPLAEKPHVDNAEIDTSEISQMEEDEFLVERDLRGNPKKSEKLPSSNQEVQPEKDLTESSPTKDVEVVGKWEPSTVSEQVEIHHLKTEKPSLDIAERSEATCKVNEVPEMEELDTASEQLEMCHSDLQIETPLLDIAERSEATSKVNEVPETEELDTASEQLGKCHSDPLMEKPSLDISEINPSEVTQNKGDEIKKIEESGIAVEQLEVCHSDPRIEKESLDLSEKNLKAVSESKGDDVQEIDVPAEHLEVSNVEHQIEGLSLGFAERSPTESSQRLRDEVQEIEEYGNDYQPLDEPSENQSLGMAEGSQNEETQKSDDETREVEEQGSSPKHSEAHSSGPQTIKQSPIDSEIISDETVSMEVEGVLEKLGNEEKTSNEVNRETSDQEERREECADEVEKLDTVVEVILEEKIQSDVNLVQEEHKASEASPAGCTPIMSDSGPPDRLENSVLGIIEEQKSSLHQAFQFVHSTTSELSIDQEQHCSPQTNAEAVDNPVDVELEQETVQKTAESKHLDLIESCDTSMEVDVLLLNNEETELKNLVDEPEVSDSKPPEECSSITEEKEVVEEPKEEYFSIPEEMISPGEIVVDLKSEIPSIESSSGITKPSEQSSDTSEKDSKEASGMAQAVEDVAIRTDAVSVPVETAIVSSTEVENEIEKLSAVAFVCEENKLQVDDVVPAQLVAANSSSESVSSSDVIKEESTGTEVLEDSDRIELPYASVGDSKDQPEEVDTTKKDENIALENAVESESSEPPSTLETINADETPKVDNVTSSNSDPVTVAETPEANSPSSVEDNFEPMEVDDFSPTTRPTEDTDSKISETRVTENAAEAVQPVDNIENNSNATAQKISEESNEKCDLPLSAIDVVASKKEKPKAAVDQSPAAAVRKRAQVAPAPQIKKSAPASIAERKSKREPAVKPSPSQKKVPKKSQNMEVLLDNSIATPRRVTRKSGEKISLSSSDVSSKEDVMVDTITGMAEPDVCIIPDDLSASTTRRTRRSTEGIVKTPSNESTARPKRNAARAADSKIKSLVLNALEPVSLEEVEEPVTKHCAQCKRIKLCRFQASGVSLCSEDCHAMWTSQSLDAARSCAHCRGELPREGVLLWETMDFCREDCLDKYQKTLGSHCANCNKAVAAASMGKFCVRFGYEIRQFCAPSCLEEYKKGLKVCSYCQKDISGGAEGFLAPVGDKGQFKDFCSQSCMGKYKRMSGSTPEDVAECSVCSHNKTVTVEVLVGSRLHKLCSEPCFAAFKFVNNICEGQCEQCKKYFDKVQADRLSVYSEDGQLNFCCKTCLNVFILANRKIVACSFCKVKKYNFDMIRKNTQTGKIMACSLSCLAQSQTSGNIIISCDCCLNPSKSPFKLPMTDGTSRNVCSYTCAAAFQSRQAKSPVTTSGGPVKVASSTTKVSSRGTTSDAATGTHLKSIAVQNGPPAVPQVPVSPAPPSPQVYQHIITRPPEPKSCKNKAILCKPYMHNKGTSCRPMPCYKHTQTEENLTRKCLIPVPVPIYVPAPMHMYSSTVPMPVPFPLPVPVPIFIPTTRNSVKGIFKEIKKIQEKIPTDPFEAELLMMAEMVAGEKKQDPTDSESEDGADADVGAETFSPEPVDTSNAFGEDVLQMALKMASELEEPAVDMESVLTPSTITPSAQPTVDSKNIYVPADPDDPTHALAMARGRKRPVRGGRGGAQPSKRGRRSGPDIPPMVQPEPVQPQRMEVEKPDANLCLKYTFGVNAWRHWVMQKNAELEKAALTNRKIKPFKPELLQLTADELNFSLCLFVKEVKKPNGQEYAPDTIYYLCLGIQQYLFENGRIDNIFTDSYYEKFTDCLDEVAKKFAVLYNDSQFIVTRVEEEHLWESKQLGAHSPHVLLSTLMFFNTKHFNLVTVEEHMQLSFSHIMKHWKRNPNAPGVAKIPGSRNVLLRFYPPQSALEANSKKKKVYEQQENEENPLRCPVKLYEFYLSKCPESVKTRNDVFYLLPERSCVPDSPVWYSTMALGKEPLMKMLHRIKMVKEINIALLTC